MSEPLPPFSGDNPTCPKCGNTRALTAFLPYGQCVYGGGQDLIIGFDPNERLHRECTRCGYAWDEATVEQPPTKIEGGTE